MPRARLFEPLDFEFDIDPDLPFLIESIRDGKPLLCLNNSPCYQPNKQYCEQHENFYAHLQPLSCPDYRPNNPMDEVTQWARRFTRNAQRLRTLANLSESAETKAPKVRRIRKEPLHKEQSRRLCQTPKRPKYVKPVRSYAWLDALRQAKTTTR